MGMDDRKNKPVKPIPVDKPKNLIEEALGKDANTEAILKAIRTAMDKDRKK